MYRTITKALNEAASDDKVRVAVLRGTGAYYSSGNDLAQFTEGGDLKARAAEAKEVLKNFVGAFIDFPKPLIGAINGPAFGIMVTTLPLCDLIIASEKATFVTPFGSTAQSPEGCSSHTFPAIMGTSRANQMLMFNHKMTAMEAEAVGFVGKVVPDSEFEGYLEEWFHGEKGVLKTCSQHSMVASKALIRSPELKAKLWEVNRVECDKLVERWLSSDFPEFIMRALSKKG
jgi:peroxisomal 3,2-trans-enoyl-CoA isomerase